MLKANVGGSSDYAIAEDDDFRFYYGYEETNDQGDWLFKAWQKQSAGKPFRPSNGTEDDMFHEVFCDRCWRDAKYRRTRDGRDGCPILAASFLHNVGDEGYP